MTHDEEKDMNDIPKLVMVQGMSLKGEFFLLVRAALVSCICVGHFLLNKFTTLETIGMLALVIVWMVLAHTTDWDVRISTGDSDSDRNRDDR